LFFYLSKICWFLLQPSTLIALTIMGAGFALSANRTRAACRLVWLAFVAFVVLGLSPLGGALLLPLEQRFPRPDLSAPGTHIDGIVVLGGAEDPRTGALRGEISLNDAAERLVEPVQLLRQFPDAKLIFAGGSDEIVFGKPPEAETAQRFFAAMGIAPERILLDPRSRNTYENAVYAREIAKPAEGARWLIVTSAFHMPRAVGCFRKAGFAVEAYPVDYRTAGPREILRPFSSIPEGLRRIDMVAKEYVGLLTYYLTGRTDALLPAP